MRKEKEMNIQIFGTKKCNDTKKAERFFKERGIRYQFIDMKEKGMSKGEFLSVAQGNGGLENMIQWEGKDHDTLALIRYLADEDKLEKVLENPQVIKTPVVRKPGIKRGKRKMKLYAACMMCLLSAQERKLREYRDEDKKARYIKELMRLTAESKDDACAPWLAARIGEVYEKYFGAPEDYGPIKESYNRLVMDMESEIEGKIRSAKDPLYTAMRYARIGNYIDFSAVSDVRPEEFLSLLDREKDSIDEEEYRHFIRELEGAERLVYLLDNCGEIVLDKLVIRILKEQYPQLKITAIVRGAQVINDATVEDAVFTGLTGEAEVIGNGDNAAGTILSRISPEASAAIEAADVILSKGQGNFEALHGCGLNIYYLFLCKCDWFMKKFQVDRYQGMFVNERRVHVWNEN